MNKFKSRVSKLVILTIGVLLALTLSLVLNDDLSVFAEGSSAVAEEVKIYSRVTLDEDFDDSSVIVIMNKRTGGVNKRHDDGFFGDFAKKSVYDLTYTEEVKTSRAEVDEENFNQILKIELTERSKENVISVIRQLEKVDGILAVEPNYIYRSALLPPSATAPTTGAHRYPNLWGIHGNRGIQAEGAWNITTGVRNSVRVGVIDSGMDNHADIAANRVNEGGDFVNMTNINQNIPGPLRADPDGHGTHVSGTIGATGANANGVTGVAWNVQLIPLQVSFWWVDPVTGVGDWRWNADAIVRAINWSRTHNVDIINFSGGGGGNSIAIRNAINHFQGLFVAAAGNGGDDNIGDNNDTLRYYPSDYSRGQPFSNRFMSVGAIDNVGNRPNFSNWGENSVSIFAPGVNILSTVPNTINATGYASWQGTSMATPHVTGTAALMWSILTNSSSNLTRAEMAETIKTLIINNAVTDDIGTPLNNLSISDGRLNTFKAVSATVFTTAPITGGIAITGLRSDFSLANNTNLILPNSFAPIGTTTQQNVVAIDANAFANQTQLTQILIPNSVTSIGSNAFENCTNLTDITLSRNLTSIGSGAFQDCKKLAEIIIPYGVTSIADNTFKNCSNLKYAQFPSSMTSIGSGAFQDCTELNYVLLSAGIRSVGDGAFKNCVALSNMIVQAGIQSIAANAFQNCIGLTNLTIPSTKHQ